ncbi:DUF1883 domain-containing protein [Candidatus Saccharibacteria bacterium]|nr:DUF1883 domain-containing protein [Candidatus Saccharibacteria bacterium]
MEFGYFDLGYLAGGEIVEVSISSAANVCLMEYADFFYYKNGCSFNYRGGYSRYSPVRITVPHGGRWYVTVDLGGYSGRLSYDCQIIRPQSFFEQECNYTWEGKPAKRYPNRKDPARFTDILYGGGDGISDGDGHGHIIIENSTGEIVFHREPGEKAPKIWNQEKCP